MIYRNRLPRPSRYLPVVAAALAVMVFLPEGMIPGGDNASDTAEATDVRAEAPLASIATAAPPVEELGLQRPGSGTPVQPVLKTAEAEPEPQPAVPVQTVLPEADAVQVATLDPSAEQDELAPTSSATPTDGYFLAAASAGAISATPDASRDGGAGIAGSITRVGDSALNVRAGPSSSTAKLFVLQPGEQVRVAEMDGGWALVVRANGESGWAYSRYLAGPTDAGPNVVASARAAEPDQPRRDASTASVERRPAAPEARESDPGTRYARIDSDVAARAGPSRNAPRLFVLPAGERVAIAEFRDGWAHVVVDSGVSGWVRYR